MIISGGQKLAISRVAHIVASWHHGLKEIDREWENEEEMDRE